MEKQFSIDYFQIFVGLPKKECSKREIFWQSVKGGCVHFVSSASLAKIPCSYRVCIFTASDNDIRWQ